MATLLGLTEAHAGYITPKSSLCDHSLGQVNLEFDTLDDTPDVFWDYEETEPLYKLARPKRGCCHFLPVLVGARSCGQLS